MLNFGNPVYYVTLIFIMLNLTVFSVKFLKNKDDQFIHVFIFSILLSAFVLHFLKLQFEPYASKWPKSLRNISFENVCASSTLLFPWFYLSKNKLLKDYMIVIGLFSGLGAVLLPYRGVGFEKFTIDIVRFYYAHYILFLAPFLMLMTRQYQFNIKCIFKVPLLFYVVLTFIFINEVVLIALGIVNGDLNTLLDPNSRNAALIFGPSEAMAQFDWLYSLFVPDLFQTVPFGARAGEPMFWPVIWMIIPLYFYLCIIGVIIDVVFNVILKKSEKFAVSTTSIDFVESLSS